MPHFYYIAFGLIGLSLPCIFCYLKEEPKQKTTTCRNILRDLYRTSQRQAVWQILLYTLVPLVLGTLLGVNNAAMTNANRVWLKLTTFQTTVIIIMDNLVLVVVLQFIRKKGLTVRFVDHLSYTSDTKSRLFDLLTQFTPSLSSLSPVSTDIFLEKNTTHRQSVPPLHQPYVPFDRVCTMWPEILGFTQSLVWVQNFRSFWQTSLDNFQGTYYVYSMMVVFMWFVVMRAILPTDPSSERWTRKRMTNSTERRTEEYSGSGLTRRRKTRSGGEGKKQKKVDRVLYTSARCGRPSRPLVSCSTFLKKWVVRYLGAGGRRKDTIWMSESDRTTYEIV